MRLKTSGVILNRKFTNIYIDYNLDALVIE